MTDGAAHVELEGIAKHYGGVRALDDISLSIRAGSIHALVGENGAGKSTLAKIIGGAISPDGGRMSVHGEPAAFRSPREALASGIASIAQELLLVPRLTVAENVFLGVEPRRLGWLSRGELRTRYEQLAQQAGFDLPADRPAGRMRTAEQQQVEILRALARDAQLIVMDEPSAALSRPDVERLHEIVRSLVASGKTVLLVSHFLREVLELADSVTVLRDGRLVRTGAVADETEESLIQAMLGRSLGKTFPAKVPADPSAELALSVRGLSAHGVDDVSLEVHEGEIVGLAGLVGAGRTELARAIFGAARRSDGTVELAGAAVPSGAPIVSLRHGLGMIPESRKADGLLFRRSLVENVSLSNLGAYSRAGVVNRRSELRAATEVLDSLSVKAASYQAPVASLSGGNQQKVLFARMLMCNPKLLIADEPTRGVDVGAKRAIYELLVSLGERGMGVLLISSELEEILGLAHRALVMRRGRIVTELRGDQMSESTILAAAFSGVQSTESAA